MRNLTDFSRETFLQLAWELISDGNINWHRVVMLFILASSIFQKSPKECILQIVIRWTLDFLCERFLLWIRDQGSWESLPVLQREISSRVSLATGSTVAFIALGALTAFIVVQYKI
uniref:apoptosis regulator BAX-like n=1 Tax=Pristiophorus japonicus TaxID=55135 RepID=UPI00398EC734